VQLAQVDLNRCKQDVAACLIEQGTTFLLVKIEWNSDADVDLYVTDPKGNQFSLFKRSYPGSQARLSTDKAKGPGVEVWQTPAAEPGPYRIEYVVGSNPDRAVTVKGLYFDKGGKKELPDKILGNGNSRVLAGIIEVSANGGVELR
jgi:hypothetical protein